MSFSSISYVPGSQAHEQAIVAAIAQQKGLQEIEASRGTEERELIDAHIQELCKTWPKEPKSSSTFINTFFTVSTRVLVDLDSDNLFLDEIVQKVHFGPLFDNFYGQLTTDDLEVKIECTEIIKSEAIKLLNDSDVAYINSKQPLRIGLQGRKQIVHGKVTATFNGVRNSAVDVQIEKNDKGSFRLIVPLFRLRGKVNWNGMVTLTEKIFLDGKIESLEKGKPFNILSVLGNKKATLIMATVNDNSDFLPFK